MSKSISTLPLGTGYSWQLASSHNQISYRQISHDVFSEMKWRENQRLSAGNRHATLAIVPSRSPVEVVHQ